MENELQQLEKECEAAGFRAFDHLRRLQAARPPPKRTIPVLAAGVPKERKVLHSGKRRFHTYQDPTRSFPHRFRRLGDGEIVRIPVGVRKYVVEYGGIRRRLRLDPTTGEVRHEGPARPVSITIVRKGEWGGSVTFERHRAVPT